MGNAGMLVGRGKLEREARDWRRLVELLDDTSRDFEELSPASLPAGVRPAGEGFRAAWAGHARAAAGQASGILAGLEQTLRDLEVTDQQSAAAFGVLAVGCPAPAEASGIAPSDLTDRLGALP